MKMVCTQKKKVMQSRRSFLRNCIFTISALLFGKWAMGRIVEPLPWDITLKSLSHDLMVIPRSAWTTFSPVLTRVKRSETFSRLTVHHAGNGVNTHVHWNSVVDDLNGILGSHMRKEYGDIGYHFVIDYIGRVWECRSLTYEGAHVSGQNIQNIGIMLLGNFEEQYPSPSQVSSLFSLTIALRQKYSIPIDSIYGHRDLGQSICPGKHLYEPFVTELRQS